MVSRRMDVQRRYTHYDDSPGSTHNLVVGLVEPGSRVLEFGCATGYMSQVLRDRLGATVVGVELQAEAAQEAMAHCERVLVGDAEELDLEAELGGERFDAVLFADVLEHLRDPASLLRRVRPFVADGGSVIASIPNVAHASVRMALLAGSFRYREQGLLDEMHLRFFTREGIQDLLEGSGYVATRWLRRRIQPEETEIPIPSSLPEEARAWATGDTDATTYQFIVQAVPSAEAAQLRAERRKLEQTRNEVDEWRAKFEQAHNELDDLRSLRERVHGLELELAERPRATVDELKAELAALRRAHEVLRRRILTERVAFAEGIAAVQEEVYGSRSWRYMAPMRAVVHRLRRLKP
jgi:SAM-dependent methyltransferase